MNDGQMRQTNMIETTDCLEAVAVFRAWKNFFFFVVIMSLLVVQTSFWLVDRKIVPLKQAEAQPTNETPPADPNVVRDPLVQAATEPATTEKPQSSAKQLLSELLPVDKIDFNFLARIIGITEGVLLLAAMLYCLAMFFSLVASLIGKLGGLGHISRGYFLSLIAVILLIPWQEVFGHSVLGAVFSPSELQQWILARTGTLSDTVFYYLRFCGYSVLVALLLIMSQERSARWTKSILRRLEII